MGKTKTSKKQKRSLADRMRIVKVKAGIKTTSYSPTRHMQNAKFIAKALCECLLKGDKKAFKTILAGHLKARNLSQLSRDSGVPLRTIYEAISAKGNPSLDTIVKLVHKTAS